MNKTNPHPNILFILADQMHSTALQQALHSKLEYWLKRTNDLF